jgi:hypothetical protein
MRPGVSLSTLNTHLKYFSCTLSTSFRSFHPQISVPYISTLSTMLSNIMILLPNLPPHFLFPIPQTHPTNLVRFPHYLSHLRLVRGFLVEGVAQVLEPAHSSYLAFFPLPLVLLTLPFSLVEHHHFRLLNIRFQFFFLSHILSQVPHHFSSFFFSSLFTKWSRMYTLPIVPLPFLNPAWLSDTTPFSTLCSSDNHL